MLFDWMMGFWGCLPGLFWSGVWCWADWLFGAGSDLGLLRFPPLCGVDIIQFLCMRVGRSGFW